MTRARSLPVALLALLLATSLIAAGCGSKDDSATSGNAVEKAAGAITAEADETALKTNAEVAFTAIANGDGKTACALMSERVKKANYAPDCEKKVADDIKNSSVKMKDGSLKIGKTSIKGDKATVEATATMTDDAVDETVDVALKFTMVKENSIWALDDIEQSEAS